MNVWILGLSADWTDFPAISTSLGLARARAAMIGRRTSLEIWLTLEKSSSEATENPASMMSTPKSSSCIAIRSFSAMDMVKPGDCSPSLRVVSKTLTLAIANRFLSILKHLSWTRPGQKVLCFRYFGQGHC